MAIPAALPPLPTVITMSSKFSNRFKNYAYTSPQTISVENSF